MLYNSNQFLEEDRYTLDQLTQINYLSKDREGNYFVHNKTPTEIEELIYKMSLKTSTVSKYTTSTQSLTPTSSVQTVSMNKLGLVDKSTFKKYAKDYYNIKSNFNILKECCKNIKEGQIQHLDKLVAIQLGDRLTIESIKGLMQIQYILEHMQVKILEEDSFDLHRFITNRDPLISKIVAFLQDENIQKYYRTYKSIISSLEELKGNSHYNLLTEENVDLESCNEPEKLDEALGNLMKSITCAEAMSKSFDFEDMPYDEHFIGEIADFKTVVENSIEYY